MRDLLMLAKDYTGQDVRGWTMTRKLDGIRALWVPWSRGKHIISVPWANLDKIQGPTRATGLWSRYGNIIHCPEWWAVDMPCIPIDCELYGEGLSFQEIVSTVKRHTPDERWELIYAHAFDSPKWHKLMLAGQIRNLNMERMIKFQHRPATYVDGAGLAFVNDPRSQAKRCEVLEGRTVVELEDVKKEFATLPDDAEGLMLRDPKVEWLPKRTKSLLKVKRFHTGEGKVVGLTPGKGKLLGMTGSVIVSWDGIRFSMGGFTEAERPYLVVGQDIKFTYNFLSDSGIPLKPRYRRK